MRRRASREIEIFSLSAIDLFAAAMGAFALLTIVLMPFYQKEIQERTPENAIADLLRAAENSVVATEDQRKALEAKRSAAASNVSSIKSDAEAVLAKLRAAEAALLEKKANAEPVVKVPEPVAKKPGPKKQDAVVSFRFLGMKTRKSDIVLALDMNRCMGGHEASVNSAVERVISSLQESNHRLQVFGFQQTDAGPSTQVWPGGGGLRSANASTKSQAISFAQNLTTRFGGSASMLAAFESMINGPGEAIFLVSDGLPNPRANNGLRPNQLITRITQLNAGRKEIHTIVVGNYFDYTGTVEFMERLAEQNGGQFLALASAASGVCD